MNPTSMTLKDLLTHPDMAGKISRNLEDIEQTMTETRQDTSDPFFIRILAGIGAWFAMLFIILFLFAANIIDTDFGSFGVGILFLLSGIAFNRIKGGVFARQFCLALVFAGHVLVLIGAMSVFDDTLTVVCAAHGVLCLAVYPLFGHSVYRFTAPVAFSILAVSMIIVEHWFDLFYILVIAEGLLVGALLLNKKLPPALTPLLYASVIMLPCTFLMIDFTQIGAVRMFTDFLYEFSVLPPLFMWISSLTLSLGLVFLFVSLSGGLQTIKAPWMMLAVGATVLLGAFTTPGILAMIGILAGGHARGDRVIMGLANLFLFVFLVLFYYSLHVDLAFKSWVLGGSGILLLTIRALAGMVQTKEVSA